MSYKESKPVSWTPSEQSLRATHLHTLMQERGLKDFAAAHAWSVNDPEAFWERTLKALKIVMRKPYSQILDVSAGPHKPQWLKGAELNIAQSCLTGAKDRAAIITQRITGKTETLTLDALDRLSNRVANGLKAQGIGKGDTIAIDMTMTAEAVASYLGILKCGAAVISIPDSFPKEEITKRMRIGKARAVITQDELVRAGKRLPMYAKVCEAEAPLTIVIPAEEKLSLKLREGDIEWRDFLSNDDAFETVICAPHDTINILFSSGTTGEPKAIPWDHTTAIKAASDAMYHQDIHAGDVVCWPTNLGWMMGPWLIFAGLVNGATLALYEGTPVERGFCEFVEKAGVTMLGLVPSIVKGWQKGDMTRGIDWSALRTFSSSGEASNVKDYGWLMTLGQKPGVSKPIVEYCGGTEVGGAYVSGNLVLPQNPSEFNGKCMSIDFVVLDENAKPVKDGEMGEVFLVAPAMGLSTRLLNADNDKVYYADAPRLDARTLRRHGDRIRVLSGSRFQSDGRADDTMNLGGIKTSSAEIERVVNAVPGVVETAAIGVPPKDGGPDRLVIYTVVKEGATAESLKVPMQKAIREHLNPLFPLHEVIVIDALPRTASNKVIHKDLRKRYRDSEAA